MNPLITYSLAATSADSWLPKDAKYIKIERKPRNIDRKKKRKNKRSKQSRKNNR